jgi:hypothetical protein
MAYPLSNAIVIESLECSALVVINFALNSPPLCAPVKQSSRSRIAKCKSRGEHSICGEKFQQYR